MAAPNCREFAARPSLGRIHGQLLFLPPQILGRHRRTSEEVSEGLTLGFWPHWPVSASPCAGVWHAAWICVACGLRLCLRWFSWKRISCLTHGEWPLGRLCLGFIHSTNIYWVLLMCGTLASLCLWGSPVEMCVGAGVLESVSLSGRVRTAQGPRLLHSPLSCEAQAGGGARWWLQTTITAAVSGEDVS